MTRDRILAVAMELFAAHGYHRTSVRAIAEQLDISKAAVLYHFPAKYDILAGLAEPLLTDLEAVTDLARAAAPDRVRRVAVEALLDALLRHRYLLRLQLHDLAMSAPGPIFDRFRDSMMSTTQYFVGPNPPLAEKIRATQALGMLSDPVVIYADAADPDVLRAEVLSGVWRLLGEPADAEGPPEHSRGRPKAMTSDQVATARRLHEVDGMAPTDIAATLGVSRATVYRCLKK